jgi:glutathione S-transferase
MKLYYAPGACSLAVHIVAREAGIPLGLDRVDLASQTTAGGQNYRSVNPKGYVPAVALDDGSVLTEVAAIIQYLADQGSGPSLAPANRPFLTGDTFTIADAYLFTVVNWTNFHHMDLSPFPHLKAFQARVASRPKVQEALEAEGLKQAA